MDETTRQATRLWTVAQPAVSAFLASAVFDFRDRDDLLQDVAVAVVESFGNYDPQRPFVAWALGVARNQVGLYLRRRRRESMVFDEQTLDCLVIAFAEEAPKQSGKLDFLNDCLGSLGSRARQLCELRYRDDLKPAAIAARLGQNANAVAKALQRIRDQLRICIERKADAEGGVS